MSNIPNYSNTPITTINTNNTAPILQGALNGTLTPQGGLPNYITVDSPESRLNKKPCLYFKLFKAENGYILEANNQVPDYNYMYTGIDTKSNSKVYVMDSIENLGSKIEQVLSVYLLQKD